MTSIQQHALKFHLGTIAELDTLLATDPFAHIDQEVVDMLLDQAVRFSDEYLLPLAASGDVEGCRLADDRVTLPDGTRAAYQAWVELGFPQLCLPLENDGLQAPLCLQSAIQFMFDSTNLSFGMMTINVRCALLTLMEHTQTGLLTGHVEDLINGASSPTIAISEPQAGSDVGRISTTATPAEDGLWEVNGSKCWISFGDHDATDNILHLVLARVPGTETGVRGLGLFLVPRLWEAESNGVNVPRIEEKMGLHASPTCEVSFSASRAILLGEPGQGIQNLFVMMNAMRQAVGIQGAAVACMATELAQQYAQERAQGGRPDQPPVKISSHADVCRMLYEMTATSEMLRALALKTAAFMDKGSHGDENEQGRYRKMAALLLPVSKTLGAELGFDTVNLGIQVMGGNGYTTDYVLERLARDIRVASIYEGTSGIQSKDFIRRKILADNCCVLSWLLEIIETDLANTPETPLHAGTSRSLQQFRDVLGYFSETVEQDSRTVDAGAYAGLRLAGLLFMAWNGVILYHAASGDTKWERNLRMSLNWYSLSIAEQADLWTARAKTPAPEYPFHSE